MQDLMQELQQLRSELNTALALLKERGIRSIGANAFELFAQGLTSLEEVYPLLYN